ncbi:MAG TPA: 50S ribosomal protein L18e [Candidatus Thermoplasmatota archaeon]|jgi:large subunit ribosomal protein L18e|nr:50S ribosomal protein L18e [Candidatus Thermoplasmatota archaeon]
MPLQYKTNPVLVDLIHRLKKAGWDHEAPIWRDIALRLEKPTKRRVEVNLSRIDRSLREGETALVPGKLLAAGELTKRVDVAAYAFSEAARAKITAAGGKCLTYDELMKANPSGTKVRIVG